MLGASAGDWSGSSRLIPFGQPVVPDEYAAMQGGTKLIGSATPFARQREVQARVGDDDEIEPWSNL
jgi:hypothetical protein